MSVPKYERKKNNAVYVQKCKQAYIATIENINKLQGRYSYGITNQMLEDASNMYSLAAYADGIFMEKKNCFTTFYLRQKAIEDAIGKANGLSSLLNILYEIIRKGDDAFGNKNKRDRVFQIWSTKIEEAIKLLKSIKLSDEERFEKWKKEIREQKARKIKPVDEKDMEAYMDSLIKDSK